MTKVLIVVVKVPVTLSRALLTPHCREAPPSESGAELLGNVGHFYENLTVVLGKSAHFGLEMNIFVNFRTTLAFC